jgi:hypothetical protein
VLLPLVTAAAEEQPEWSPPALRSEPMSVAGIQSAAAPGAERRDATLVWPGLRLLRLSHRPSRTDAGSVWPVFLLLLLFLGSPATAAGLLPPLTTQQYGLGRDYNCPPRPASPPPLLLNGTRASLVKGGNSHRPRDGPAAVGTAHCPAPPGCCCLAPVVFGCSLCSCSFCCHSPCWPTRLPQATTTSIMAACSGGLSPSVIVPESKSW